MKKLWSLLILHFCYSCASAVSVNRTTVQRPGGNLWVFSDENSILTSAVTVSAHRVPYGGDCNKTMRCLSEAWLTCSEGKCACLKPEEMIYDSQQKKCMSKAGERCKFAVGNLDDGSIMYDVAPCVPNADCSASGFCACNSRFYETEGGFCTLSSGHDEVCNEKVKCSAYKALNCQVGVCSCDVKVSEYHIRHEQCVGLAEETCINGHCTDHATCSRRICTCKDDYYRNNEGHCVPKIQAKQACKEDFQCIHKPFMKLQCVNGVCDCDPSEFHFATVYTSDFRNTLQSGFYGFRTGSGNVTQCVPLAEKPCIKGLCTPGAYCVYDRHLYYSGGTEISNGTCLCMGDRIQSKSNRCGYTYDKSCKSGDDCIDGLVCKNLQCSCPVANQLFRDSTQICYSKVNGPCKSDVDCGLNAQCHPLGKGFKAGSCKCNGGFVTNATGDCEVAHGGKCTNKTDCDSVSGLDCINNICQCGGFEVFDAQRRKCLGRTGSHCQLDVGYECVDLAHCTSVHPKLPAVCTCIEGSVVTKDYTCALVDNFGPSNDGTLNQTVL